MKHKYIFPNAIAEVMNRVDQRTQYEASMLSMFMIMLGLIASAVYTIIYLDLSLFFKITIGVNGFFAFIYLSSGLVTTYQQYVTYMGAIDIQED